MMSRKAYVRVTVRIEQPDFSDDVGATSLVIEVIAGVELRADEFPSLMYGRVQQVLYPVARVCGGSHDDGVIAHAVERALLQEFPDRGYFIEVGAANHDNYVQIYDPHPEGHPLHHEGPAT